MSSCINLNQVFRHTLQNYRTIMKNLFIFLFLCTFALLNTDENSDKILKVLEKSLYWKKDAISISPLPGGLTNFNYKVVFQNTPFFVRLDGGEKALLNISLEREYEILKFASRSGISAKVIFYDPLEGILMTTFIEGCSKKINLRNPEDQKRFCQSIKSLHKLEETLPWSLCPFEAIEKYRSHSIELGANISERIKNSLMPLINQLKPIFFADFQLVPCHNDLHVGNLIDDGEKIWLIDWEYAAMGDPLFDLATAASVEEFSNMEMEELLKSYLQKNITETEINSFHYKRALADARWGFWCHIQAKAANFEANFDEQAEKYLIQSLNRLEYLANIIR